MEMTNWVQIREKTVCEVAEKMLLAAQTAPKGRGVDNLVMLYLTGEKLITLAKRMKEIGEQNQVHSFVRDADNILKAQALVLIGTKVQSMGLKKCGWCGFENCAEKETHPEVPCVFNTGDLGIAIGSAVSVAMDFRVDNRIMYSAGYAALELGLMDDKVKIAYGIPLSATHKNPFFDRG